MLWFKSLKDCRFGKYQYGILKIILANYSCLARSNMKVLFNDLSHNGLVHLPNQLFIPFKITTIYKRNLEPILPHVSKLNLTIQMVSLIYGLISYHRAFVCIGCQRLPQMFLWTFENSFQDFLLYF